MRTQEGSNVAVVAVRGNFDDAQTGVKKIFGNEAIRRKIGKCGLMFSSANSINWGRLLPQTVYYFSAWCDLVNAGKIAADEAVDFCVPTGNFGDILAGYYARKMGLPIHRLICASNANNVLTDFLKTGTYDRNRPFRTTISPSMDILISSNLERLLYDITGCDGEKVAGWMKQLGTEGKYTVDARTLEKIQNIFAAGFCSDEETKEEIRRVYGQMHYLCDPHTAVASCVGRRYRETDGSRTHLVLVSTASPYKFAPDVLSALTPDAQPSENVFEDVRRLASITGTAVPTSIAALETKPVRFSQTCEKDGMGDAVLAAAEGKA